MEEKMDVMLKLLSLMHSDLTVMQSDFKVMQSDINDMKSDVSVLKSDVSVLKSDVSVLKSDVAELKTQTSKNTKKIDQLVKHAIKNDERFERLEQQMLAIGVELKEENKELDQRVTNLETEVFHGITH